MPACDLLGIECYWSSIHHESIHYRDSRLALLVHSLQYAWASVIFASVSASVR